MSDTKKALPRCMRKVEVFGCSAGVCFSVLRRERNERSYSICGGLMYTFHAYSLRHVVLDAKLSLDDLSDALSSPDLPKPEVLGGLFQGVRGASRCAVSQRVLADGPDEPWSRGSPCPPHGPFSTNGFRTVTDAKRLSNIGLPPTFLLQLEGPEAPGFAPIRGIRVHDRRKFGQQASSGVQNTVFRELIRTSVKGENGSTRLHHATGVTIWSRRVWRHR